MEKGEETARYIASDVSTQLMLKTMFEIVATRRTFPPVPKVSNQMLKITGLDKLQRQLEDAQRAFKAAGSGWIACYLSFDPDRRRITTCVSPAHPLGRILGDDGAII